jgi:Flp pilus assembly protein TadG
MKNKPTFRETLPLIASGALLILIAGFALLALMASPSATTFPSYVPSASSGPSATPTPVPVANTQLATSYLASVPPAGLVTSVRINQVSQTTTDPTNPSAPVRLSVYVTVVPGRDLGLLSLNFTFTPANSGATLASASVDPFTSGAAESFWVDFLVPHQTSAGSFAATIPGAGGTLFRQKLTWLALP